MFNAQIQFNFKTEKALNKAHSIVNPGFIYYQMDWDNVSFRNKLDYLKKNRFSAMLMGTAKKLGGKELKDIAPELKNNKVWLEIDHNLLLLTVFIEVPTKQRAEEILEMQSEGLYKNKKNINIELIRHY